MGHYKEKVYARVGRPSMYTDPRELIDYAEAYISSCLDDGKTPNEAGLTVHCFGSKRNLKDYMKKPLFEEAFEEIYCMLEDETINSKCIDGVTKKLILQGKYGYSEKIETNNKTENVIRVDDASQEKYRLELESKYGIKVIE